MIPFFVRIEPFLFQSFWIIFIFRFFLNAFVYFKISSEVVKELNKFSGGFADHDIGESLHYIFTFWFPIELYDPKAIRLLKKAANSINILFLIIAVTSLIVWTSRPR